MVVEWANMCVKTWYGLNSSACTGHNAKNEVRLNCLSNIICATNTSTLIMMRFFMTGGKALGRVNRKSLML